MKKLCFVVVALLTLASCERIDGNFLATGDLTLEMRSGSKTVAAGEYQAEIKIKSKKKIDLYLEIDGNKERARFRVPEGTRIPTENGTISLSSSEVKQPYDMYGVVETAVTRGQRRNGYESCTYQRPYTVCRPQGGCWTEYRTVHGSRPVEYIPVTKDRVVTVELRTPGTSEDMGVFTGNDVRVERDYLYYGQCF